MKYDIESFTYGSELEYGNVDRKQELPDGASWNNQDNTVVSSTGIANDPLGVLYRWGGEINTRPTETIEEHIEHIEKVNKSLSPKPYVNNNCAFHVHIRVPGLREDLSACKRLFEYITKHQEEAFSIVETYPQPNPDWHKEILKAAKKKYKKIKNLHQSKVQEARAKAMMEAESTEQFFQEHAPLTEKGRMWFFAPRAGINLRQVFEETNTVEFRHFFGSNCLEEMESCLRWSQQFLHCALNTPEVTPMEIFKAGNFKFPEMKPFIFEEQYIFDYTNVDANSRKEVGKRLDLLREDLDIDNLETPIEDIFNLVRKLQGDPKIENKFETSIFDLF